MSAHMTTNETIPAEAVAQAMSIWFGDGYQNGQIIGASAAFQTESERLFREILAADRATRPSSEALQRAREDEWDRLYELSVQLPTSAPQMWLKSLGAMLPSARAAKRQEAGDADGTYVADAERYPG